MTTKCSNKRTLYGNCIYAANLQFQCRFERSVRLSQSLFEKTYSTPFSQPKNKLGNYSRRLLERKVWLKQVQISWDICVMTSVGHIEKPPVVLLVPAPGGRHLSEQPASPTRCVWTPQDVFSPSWQICLTIECSHVIQCMQKDVILLCPVQIPDPQNPWA